MEDRARPRLNRAVTMFWGARLDDGLQFQFVSRQQAAAYDRSSLRIQAAFVVMTHPPWGKTSRRANGGHPKNRRKANVFNLINKLVKDESGQDLAEYGIALAVIAVTAGAIAVAIAGDVGTLWQNAQTAIHSAV
jgi:Flp pilus assembly pilin Flp